MIETVAIQSLRTGEEVYVPARVIDVDDDTVFLTVEIAEKRLMLRYPEDAMVSVDR